MNTKRLRPADLIRQRINELEQLLTHKECFTSLKTLHLNQEMWGCLNGQRIIPTYRESERDEENEEDAGTFEIYA